MTADWWVDPPPGDTAAPAGNGGGPGADSWLAGRDQDMAAVCPVLCLPSVGPIQCRSAEPWSPARGLRLRAEAARRLAPLADGRRDPLRPPTDAPDRHHLDVKDLWALAAQLHHVLVLDVQILVGQELMTL